MTILGISAYYHDSAAAIIKDGKIICALEEERFSRIKHDNDFPIQAIKKCLETANSQTLDCIVYYEKPLLKFERILQNFVETYPFSLRTFLKAIPEWVGSKIKVEQTIRKNLNFKGPIYFVPHHLSHAASSYYPSGYKKSAILTIDGVGEYQTTALWSGEGSSIELLKSISFPHSLGLLYSTFTSFLGFRVNEDEYKVMGMSAYGSPKYKKEIYKLIDCKNDGSFKLDMNYFLFHRTTKMWSSRFTELFGNPRESNQAIQQTHMNIARSLQDVFEEIYFKILNHLYILTSTKNVCISGGVALNALANGKIFTKTPFENVYIFGASGDSGGAVGAALYINYLLEKKQIKIPVNNLLLGNEYSAKNLEQNFKNNNLNFKKVKTRPLIRETAKLLAENNVIGWFQGKMEFGPRALGGRSILASPRLRLMHTKVNKIKARELFRPFAASVLEEKASFLFELPYTQKKFPFMNFCFKVKKEYKDKLRAVTHKDQTCRIQTINSENGIYYQLLSEFYKESGVPALLNTSFNLKGEPIVETPEQAIEDFMKTRLDYLVIGEYLISKKNISF